MYKVLLFAGTTEGRELCSYLAGCGVQVVACVATEYGQTLIDEQPLVQVHAGRLDEEQMEALMRQDFSMVIDATHPYAEVVSQNILSAAKNCDLPCYRCLRQQSSLKMDAPDILWAQDTAQAVSMLGSIEGNILLTTGSKELAAYTAVPGFAERVYPRVLPLASVVESCLKLGVPAAHLIAMQGPFYTELNLAMIRQWNIRCLVTKESGRAGGFDEKAQAARQAGIPLLIIGRPQEQNAMHFSPEQLREELHKRFGIAPKKQEAPYFPMFVSLAGKRVQVVGAGVIAARRIATLSRFGCIIEVIAPQLHERCQELYAKGVFIWHKRPYQKGDCTADLCLAATNDPAVNAAVTAECRQKGILVNRCDCREDCDFYFPAVVEHDGVIIGLGSDGSDHKKVKTVASQLRKSLCTPEK